MNRRCHGQGDQPGLRIPLAGQSLFLVRRYIFRYRPILNLHLRSLVHSRSMDMGKTTKSNKETKKQAVLTPKEKKSAKQAKKQASTVVPLGQR